MPAEERAKFPYSRDGVANTGEVQFSSPSQWTAEFVVDSSEREVLLEGLDRDGDRAASARVRLP